MEDKLPKGFGDYRAKETKMMESGVPADYSFKNYEECKALGIDAPRSTRVGRIPERGSQHRKYLTRSIWLNNNKLTNIRNVDALVNSVLEHPEKLGWIDFSFNYITELDDCLSKFPNLKILYLHGNLIGDIHEVFKLRGLSKLRSVTFTGNPIANYPRYRMYVITYLPQVMNLDFSPTTVKEKLHAKPGDAAKRILLAKNNNKDQEMNI